MTSDSGHEKRVRNNRRCVGEHKEDFNRFPFFCAVCETKLCFCISKIQKYFYSFELDVSTLPKYAVVRLLLPPSLQG